MCIFCKEIGEIPLTNIGGLNMEKTGDGRVEADKKNILSSEFIVASEIYHRQENGETIWYSKLVKLLEGTVSEKIIARSINLLSDWDVLKAEYGETDKKRAVRLYKVTNESSDSIKKIYETYWKPIREQFVKE